MASGLEHELAEWHRKLKALKASKRAGEAERKRVLDTQRGHIEHEKALNKSMQEQLSIDLETTSSPNQAHQERTDKLLDLVETYSRKIDVESRQLESIQQELEVSQAKVHELRRQTGGLQAAADEAKNAARALKLLENRLEQAERKFGEAIACNNELRREIDEHSKARAKFDQVYGRLQQELSARQEQLALLHTSVAVAGEARSAAARQLASAQAQEDAEERAYEAEMREAQACMGAGKELLQAQAKRLGAVVEAAASLEQAGHEAQQGDGEDGMEPEEAVRALRAASGITELGPLVEHFSGLESRNFHAFNASNEANTRIIALQKELQELQAEAEQLEEAGAQGRHKEVIRNALAKRDQALKRAEATHEKRVVLERRLALVRAGIAQALKALGAPVPPTPSKSEDAGAGHAALMQGLGTLEVRARAVVAVHSKIMDKNSAEAGGHGAPEARPSSSGSGASIGALSIGSRIVCAPPTTTSAAQRPASARPGSHGQAAPPGSSSSDDDSDGESVMPLSREQLQAQLKARTGGM